MPRRIGALLCVVALGLAACTSDDSGSSSDSTAATETSAGPETTDAAPLEVTPITVVPNPENVLSATLIFTTTTPTTATLHISGPGSDRLEPAATEPATEHEIAAVGMRADSTYELTIAVTDEAGQTASPPPVMFTTGSLPADIPPLIVTSDPAQMAPGLTLFPLTHRADPPAVEGQPPPMLGLLVAVDAEGNVVWYHRAPSPIGDARLLDNGNILYEYNDMGAREIDLSGQVVREWAGILERGRLATDQFGRTIAGSDAIPVETDSIHHEINQLPNGNFLALSTELRVAGGFTSPQCGEPADGFTGSYQLISDVIVEFVPDTGDIVNEWKLADYFEPQTNPADANVCGIDIPFIVPNFLYVAEGEVHDWTHANAAVLDEERNAILISIRHLNAVLAIRYADDDEGESGEVLWRLGPDGTLALEGDGELQYHQHAPEVQSDGSILLYDNGNERPGTDPAATDPAGRPYSRAVRYSIDDEAETVTQDWEYRSTVGGAPAYAFFVGDADTLENGNALIVNGGLVDPTTTSVQLVEVEPTGTSGGDVVFELRVDEAGWFTYRARRVPSLYVGGPEAG